MGLIRKGYGENILRDSADLQSVDGSTIFISVNFKQNAANIVYLLYSSDDVNCNTMATSANVSSTCTGLVGPTSVRIIPVGTNVRFRVDTYDPTVSNVTCYVSDLSAGIYLVKIKDLKNSIVTDKIIIN